MIANIITIGTVVAAMLADVWILQRAQAYDRRENTAGLVRCVKAVTICSLVGVTAALVFIAL